MDLTPKQLIEDVEFREVRRGYDPAEVDAFLDRVAAAMTKLQQQVTEATARASAAERDAAEARSTASQTAAAPVEVDQTVGTEQLQRTLILAQRTADAAVKEAQEEAEALRASARAEADQLLEQARSDAEHDGHATREANLAELREIDQVRQSMLADVAILERHVDTQRAGLANAIAELQRYLDDPDKLRVAPAEGVSDATVPEPASVAPTEAEPVPFQPAEPVEPAIVIGEDAFSPTLPDVPVESAPVEAAESWSAPDWSDPEPFVGEPTQATEVVAEPPTAEPIPLPGSFDPPPPIDPLPDSEPPLPLDAAVPADTAPSIDTTSSVETGPPVDTGPPIDPTADTPLPVDDSDDAFLAELRKAMTDDEPLGPRDEHEPTPAPAVSAPAPAPAPAPAESRPRPRFGRRR